MSRPTEPCSQAEARDDDGAALSGSPPLTHRLSESARWETPGEEGAAAEARSGGIIEATGDGKQREEESVVSDLMDAPEVVSVSEAAEKSINGENGENGEQAATSETVGAECDRDVSGTAETQSLHSDSELAFKKMSLDPNAAEFTPSFAPSPSAVAATPYLPDYTPLSSTAAADVSAVTAGAAASSASFVVPPLIRSLVTGSSIPGLNLSRPLPAISQVVPIGPRRSSPVPPRGNSCLVPPPPPTPPTPLATADDRESRAIMLSLLPPPEQLPDAVLAQEIERTWGPLRFLDLSRRWDGVATAHFYDLRHAKAALRDVQQQHWLQQQRTHHRILLRLRQIHTREPPEKIIQDPYRPLPNEPVPLKGLGLVAGWVVWAQAVDPDGEGGAWAGEGRVPGLGGGLEEVGRMVEAVKGGDVKEVRAVLSKKLHRLVEFFDIRAAAHAVQKLTGTELAGRRIKIEFARQGVMTDAVGTAGGSRAVGAVGSRGVDAWQGRGRTEWGRGGGKGGRGGKKSGRECSVKEGCSAGQREGENGGESGGESARSRGGGHSDESASLTQEELAPLSSPGEECTSGDGNPDNTTPATSAPIATASAPITTAPDTSAPITSAPSPPHPSLPHLTPARPMSSATASAQSSPDTVEPRPSPVCLPPCPRHAVSLPPAGAASSAYLPYPPPLPLPFPSDHAAHSPLVPLLPPPPPPPPPPSSAPSHLSLAAISAGGASPAVSFPTSLSSSPRFPATPTASASHASAAAAAAAPAFANPAGPPTPTASTGFAMGQRAMRGDEDDMAEFAFVEEAAAAAAAGARPPSWLPRQQQAGGTSGRGAASEGAAGRHEDDGDGAQHSNRYNQAMLLALLDAHCLHCNSQPACRPWGGGHAVGGGGARGRSGARVDGCGAVVMMVVMVVNLLLLLLVVPMEMGAMAVMRAVTVAAVVQWGEWGGGGAMGAALAYDFVYLPIDFKNRCNLGYAFVNLTTVTAALRLFRAFHLQPWEAFNSRKVCRISYARVQGCAALEEHFRNSRFACDTEEFLHARFSPPRNGISCPPPVLAAGHMEGQQVTLTSGQPPRSPLTL
ncbi:unnamed protein product, partial [Closterium sp. NIES-65]